MYIVWGIRNRYLQYPTFDSPDYRSKTVAKSRSIDDEATYFETISSGMDLYLNIIQREPFGTYKHSNFGHTFTKIPNGILIDI